MAEITDKARNKEISKGLFYRKNQNGQTKDKGKGKESSNLAKDNNNKKSGPPKYPTYKQGYYKPSKYQKKYPKKRLEQAILKEKEYKKKKEKAKKNKASDNNKSKKKP